MNKQIIVFIGFIMLSMVSSQLLIEDMDGEPFVNHREEHTDVQSSLLYFDLFSIIMWIFVIMILIFIIIGIVKCCRALCAAREQEETRTQIMPIVPDSYVPPSTIQGNYCFICHQIMVQQTIELTSQGIQTQRVMKCGHAFHPGCIHNLMSISNNCPICQYPLQQTTIINPMPVSMIHPQQQPIMNNQQNINQIGECNGLDFDNNNQYPANNPTAQNNINNL